MSEVEFSVEYVGNSLMSDEFTAITSRQRVTYSGWRVPSQLRL